MGPTLRLSFLALLATSALAFARPSALLNNGATEVPNEFECRCGISQFLTLPHANITAREKAMKCSSYSRHHSPSKSSHE